jgi:hypothetical protein
MLVALRAGLAQSSTVGIVPHRVHPSVEVWNDLDEHVLDRALQVQIGRWEK